ncbi:hypothetical protein EV714DRAFT_199421 [Schizophyllum commune]
MFGNITIEWDAHFNPDGTRRANGPPPSQMHGWLAKWRGTFSGNEHLRNEGLREIAKAKARNKMLKERKRKNQGGLFTRWFGNPPSKPSRKSSTHKPARRPSGATSTVAGSAPSATPLAGRDATTPALAGQSHTSAARVAAYAGQARLRDPPPRHPASLEHDANWAHPRRPPGSTQWTSPKPVEAAHSLMCYLRV